MLSHDRQIELNFAPGKAYADMQQRERSFRRSKQNSVLTLILLAPSPIPRPCRLPRGQKIQASAGP